MRITLKARIFNKVYYPYLKLDERYQIYYGGAGSGKSHFIAQKLLYNFLTRQSYNILVVRNNSVDNHNTTFALLSQLINQWGISELLTINKAKGQEEITNNYNQNKIVFKGLDDPEKIKGITFLNGVLVTIWIEEVSEVAEDKFNQLDIRLRGKCNIPKQMILTFNPINKEHWLKRRFFDIPQDDCFILKTTYKDNEFLTEADKKNLEKYKDIDFYYYQVYCLGEWGSISNARIFHNVQIHDFDYKPEQLENVRYGQDYGFNHASTLIGSGYKDGELYIFEEYYYKEHTNREFIEKVKQAGFDKRNRITADSAEPDRIKEWNNAGYKVTGAKKGKNSLLDGIDYLRSLKIHIHKTNCPNASREFLGFKYRELKDGTITEQPVEIDDDCIAAVRYSQEEFWGQLKTNIDTSIGRIF